MEMWLVESLPIIMLPTRHDNFAYRPALLIKLSSIFLENKFTPKRLLSLFHQRRRSLKTKSVLVSLKIIPPVPDRPPRPQGRLPLQKGGRARHHGGLPARVVPARSAVGRVREAGGGHPGAVDIPGRLERDLVSGIHEKNIFLRVWKWP